MASRSTPECTCTRTTAKGWLISAATGPALQLSQLPDGRIAYRLKRPLGDGRQRLLLQPTELLRRLATLVPPPRAHLVRYHGVFGPASLWRREVIHLLSEKSATAPPCASAPRLTEDITPDVTEPIGADPSSARPQLLRSTSRIPWADLLRRVFRDDVLTCPCGGRRVVLAYLTESGTVKAILEHLGLPSTGPPIAPARFSA